MTDPDVGRQTFVAVMHRQPSRAEFAKVLERRLYYLYQMVADSKDYRVLDGVEELLPRLLDDGYLLGIVTGNREAAAHVKSHRAKLNRFFSLGGYGMPRTAVSSPDRHLPGGSGLWRRGAPSPVPGHR